MRGKSISLTALASGARTAVEMDRFASALLSAAGHLTTAADDLRRAGYGAFAEEIDELLADLDIEYLLHGARLRSQSGS